jgi:hypothetical protein
MPRAFFSRAGPISENRRFQNDASLLKNAKTDAAFHRCRMKSCVCFSGENQNFTEWVMPHPAAAT